MGGWLIRGLIGGMTVATCIAAIAIVSIILTIAPAAAAVTARAASATASTSTASSASPVTITLYLYQGDQETVDWHRAVIGQFETKHPDIKVNVITSAGSDYVTKLTVLWAAGTPPDVWGQGGPVRTYVERGWLLDLTPYVKRDLKEIKPDEFFRAAWQAYEWGGKIWGLPFMSVGTFLFYNADLFDRGGVSQPPTEWKDSGWTWDDMVATARKLTAIDPTSGRLKQAGVGANTDVFGSILYSYLAGGDWFDPDAYRTGTPSRSRLNTPENVKAYSSVVNLMWQDRVAPRPGGGDFDAWSGFQSGRVAMYLGAGPWAVMGKRNVLRFPWGMAALPKITQRASIIYTDPWMVGSATKHPEAAWELVKYLTSSEVLQSYAGIAAFPPSRSNAVLPYLQRMAKFSNHHSEREILLALAGAQEYGRESIDHTINGWPDIMSTLSPIWTQMFANRKSVGESLAAADEKLNLLYGKLASGRP